MHLWDFKISGMQECDSKFHLFTEACLLQNFCGFSLPQSVFAKKNTAANVTESQIYLSLYFILMYMWTFRLLHSPSWRTIHNHTWRFFFPLKCCMKLHKTNFLFVFILSCSIKSLNNGNAQLYYCNVVNTTISINGNRMNGAWLIFHW